MFMDSRGMRAYLAKRYPGWRKLAYMPDNQILAIYLRIQSEPVEIAAAKEGSRLTVYHCEHCGETYPADNPELTECEKCGGDFQ